MASAFYPRVLLFDSTAQREAVVLGAGVIAYDLELSALFCGDGTTGGGVAVASSGSGSPSGAGGSVQYKNSLGNFGGSDALLYSEPYETTSARKLRVARNIFFDGMASYIVPSNVTSLYNLTTGNVPSLQNITILNIDVSGQSSDPFVIEGIEAPSGNSTPDGKVLIIRNVGASKKIAFANMSPNATVGNQIYAGSQSIVRAGQAFWLIYDSTNSPACWKPGSQIGTSPHTHVSNQGEGGTLDPSLIFNGQTNKYVPIAYGGTNRGSYTAGSVIYASASDVLGQLTASSDPDDDQLVGFKANSTTPTLIKPVQSITFTDRAIPITSTLNQYQPTLFCFRQAVTIRRVRAVTLGGQSLSFKLRHHADRNSISFNEVFPASSSYYQTAVNNPGTGLNYTGPWEVASVAADSWLWLQLAVATTVVTSFLNVTIDYTVN